PDSGSSSALLVPKPRFDRAARESTDLTDGGTSRCRTSNVRCECSLFTDERTQSCAPNRSGYGFPLYSLGKTSIDPALDVGQDQLFVNIAEKVVEVAFVEFQRFVAGTGVIVKELAAAWFR